MVPSTTQYPVIVTNYGRTVGEIVGYRVSARSIDQIERLLLADRQIRSLSKSDRRFVAPRDTVSAFSFDVKKILEYAGLWEDVIREKTIAAILIKVFYWDVLNRQAVRSSRFVYSYDPVMFRINALAEHTEYK
jgi:voltage-gated potassium channel Kch